MRRGGGSQSEDVQIVYGRQVLHVCQRNHWAKHKKRCKQRATELRDEALFKDPPSKEDCPICFLPMPMRLICCASLPPATMSSLPIYDFAIANEELANKYTERYYPCCGKCMCLGCAFSFDQNGNDDNCPFCNSNRDEKTDVDQGEEVMKRVEVNDAGAICTLAVHYQQGRAGFQQDQIKAFDLFNRAAELGSIRAHFSLAGVYHEGGDLKKAKFHFEAAAMAGDEHARTILGSMEGRSGNMERATKHWKIAASAGCFRAMHCLITFFEKGVVSRESIDSTLNAYNNSCVEMRSEARDAYIRDIIDGIL